jgi:hypothetical protein
MRKKLILLPLLGLILAGCGKTPNPEPSSSSEPPLPSVSEDPSEELTITPISELRTRELDSTGNLVGEKPLVATEGIITKIYRGAKLSTGDPGYILTMQDGDLAMGIYGVPEDQIANYGTVGQKLTVKGLLSPYNGLWQLADTTVIKVEDTTTVVNPEVLTSVAQEDLVNKDSKLVKIEGLHYVSDSLTPGAQGNLNVSLNDVFIGGYAHYNIPAEDIQAILDKFAAVDETGIDAMDTFDFTGIIGMNRGTYQLMVTSGDEFDNFVDGGEVTEPVEYVDLFTYHENWANGTYQLGQQAHVQGVVTTRFDNTKYSNAAVTIQQTVGTETRGLLLYRVPLAALDAAGVVVGAEVTLTGTVAEYHGAPQLTDVTDFTYVGVGAEQAALDVNAANIDTLTAHNAHVLANVSEDLFPETDIVASGTGSVNINFTFASDATKKLLLRQNADNPANEAIHTKLNGVRTIDTVNLNNLVVGWYDAPQFYGLNADDITVTPSPVETLTDLDVTIDNASFEVGLTAKITVTQVPAAAELPALTFTSSDETVATVDATGLVTGVAEGTATITVTGGGFTKTVDVTVTPQTELRHTLSADTLGLTSSYADGVDVNVDGVNWSFDQLYRNAITGEIQMRNPKAGSTVNLSALWSSTLTEKAIKRVEVHFAYGRYMNNLRVYLSADGRLPISPNTVIGTGAQAQEDTVLVSEEFAETSNFHFIRFEKDDSNTFTLFIQKIVVVTYL